VQIKDNHYWELKGLPDREGFVFGPFPIWYQNFAPIHRNTSTLTCIECNRKGYVYKFQGLRFWSWEPSGRQWMGGKDGEKFKYLPITANSNATGFNAVFHNGLPNNPMMIGISGNRVIDFIYFLIYYRIIDFKSYSLGFLLLNKTLRHRASIWLSYKWL
jgi:hypothetical protein